jgi:hypothetical protein
MSSINSLWKSYNTKDRDLSLFIKIYRIKHLRILMQLNLNTI